MNIDLRQGDSRKKLAQMIAAGEFVDSCVCDPPYHLEPTLKRFGGASAKPAQFGKDGAFSRASKGFMGRSWDGADADGRRIAQDPEFWHLVYQVMKPGAYIIAFSSSRTYGYMQVAMEAAGFITHPMFGWVFNTGFPKGHDVGKAIDRTLGEERERRPVEATPAWQRSVGNTRPYMDDPDHTTVSDEPVSDEARQWHGWKTGTQSLKPALEPVYFGQKPFSEKTGALNIMRHGVGAVNIDGCRVPMSERDAERINNMGGFGIGAEYRVPNGGLSLSGSVDGSYEVGRPTAQAHHLGRYPANLVHDGSPEVVALFPQSGGQIADASTSDTPRSSGRVYGQMKRGNGREGEATADKRYTDESSTNFAMTPGERRQDGGGSAARFFNSFPHDGPIMCHPKAGKKDRAGSKHATVKPIGLMQHFIRLVTPPGGTVLDPFAGTGTTGQAALNESISCILMEAEAEYARDIRRRFDLPETVSDKLVNLLDAL